jgi:hypothetical protein
MWNVVAGPLQIDIPTPMHEPDRIGFAYLLARTRGTTTKVTAVCTGTVATSEPEQLPGRLGAFVNTDGRSEVDRVLDWATPPRQIEVSELRPDRPLFSSATR